MQRRELNLFDAVMLVMGGIIGVGIFFTPGRVAQLVPDGGAFLGMWVLGGVIALCGATTFAELGSSFPQAGGWYVFLREAWGRFVAFLFAWVVLGVIASGACAVMTEICVSNVAALVPQLGASGSLGFKIAGALVLLGVHVLAMLGVKAGATLQNALMLLKLAAMAALVGAAFLVFEPAPKLVAAPAAPAIEFGNLTAALLPVLFACGGWQHVCYLASEVRNPKKTVPRALLLGVAGVVIVYLCVNAAYLRVVGTSGLANDPSFAQTVAGLTLGSTGGKLLSAAMAISALGVVTVTVMATPWLFVAMAREGLFFARFAELDARTGAPVYALVVQSILCLAWWIGGRAGPLVNATVAVEWIFHALAAAALLKLRWQRRDLARPFVSPLYPLAPVAYLALALLVVFSNFQGKQLEDTGVGLLVLLLGAAIYLPWRAIVARSGEPA